MMTPAPEILATLSALNATYRFVCTGVNFVDNPIPGGTPIIDTKRPPRTFCEILDLTIPGSPPYARAEGTDEQAALANAVEIARTAEKPMTPAQRHDREKVSAIVSAKDARIAQLEAQLAARGEPLPAGPEVYNGPSGPVAASPVGESAATSEAPKKRGRPKGSQNKAKSSGESIAKATGETIAPSLNTGEVPA